MTNNIYNKENNKDNRRDTIYNINSLNNKNNLKQFKKRLEYKNLINKIQKSNKGAVITIYAHPEKYEYKFDDYKSIKETIGFSSFEMSVLRDMLYTFNNYNLTKKKIKELSEYLSKKKKKSEKINLDFSYFDETNNSMNRLLLESSKSECNSANKIKNNPLKDFLCRKYLKEKIKIDIINGLKKEMLQTNDNSKKNEIYNKIEVVRKIGKRKDKTSLPSGFISSDNNNQKKLYNKYSNNINKQVNELIKENYKPIIQKGGEPVTIIILTLIVTVLTIYFKFLIIVSLFIFVLSVIPCYDQLTKGEMLERLIKKIMFDLFVTFLATFTFGFLLPPTMIKISHYLYEIFEKLFHHTSDIILTKLFFGKKIEHSEEKTNEHIISNKTEEHIIDTVLSAKPPKTNISSKMFKILKKIAKLLLIDESICRGKITPNVEYSSHEITPNLNHALNPVFTDYLYEVRCIGIVKTFGLFGKIKHYEFVIIDLASNKLIGKILIEKDFANKYYDVDSNNLKELSKSLTNEEKQKKNMETVLSTVQEENREYVKLFFLFIQALFSGKYDKKVSNKKYSFSSFFSFFKRKNNI